MLYFSNMRLYICVLRICVVVPILYLLFFNAAKPGVQGVFCFLPRPECLLATSYALMVLSTFPINALASGSGCGPCSPGCAVKGESKNAGSALL